VITKPLDEPFRQIRSAVMMFKYLLNTNWGLSSASRELDNDGDDQLPFVYYPVWFPDGHDNSEHTVIQQESDIPQLVEGMNHRRSTSQRIANLYERVPVVELLRSPSKPSAALRWRPGQNRRTEFIPPITLFMTGFQITKSLPSFDKQKLWPGEKLLPPDREEFLASNEEGIDVVETLTESNLKR